MPIRPNLLNQINSALSGSITPSLTTGSKGDDLYEAYVWSVVIVAARNRGATIEFKDRNGNGVVTTFYFRTSPGELWWGTYDYCHAEIKFANCPALEAHVGIYVGGRSQVRHECDVAVLYKSEADICRTRKVLPRASKVELAVECKYYVNSTPGLGLGRSFLGLCDEIQKPNRFFIATSHSASVAKLLSKHTRDCNLLFNPVWQHNVDVTRAVFETVFERFIAQHR
jgi:hypothetical protein